MVSTSYNYNSSRPAKHESDFTKSNGEISCLSDCKKRKNNISIYDRFKRFTANNLNITDNKNSISKENITTANDIRSYLSDSQVNDTKVIKNKMRGTMNQIIDAIQKAFSHISVSTIMLSIASATILILAGFMCSSFSIPFSFIVFIIPVIFLAISGISGLVVLASQVKFNKDNKTAITLIKKYLIADFFKEFIKNLERTNNEVDYKTLAINIDNILTNPNHIEDIYAQIKLIIDTFKQADPLLFASKNLQDAEQNKIQSQKDFAGFTERLVKKSEEETKKTLHKHLVAIILQKINLNSEDNKSTLNQQEVEKIIDKVLNDNKINTKINDDFSSIVKTVISRINQTVKNPTQTSSGNSCSSLPVNANYEQKMIQQCIKTQDQITQAEAKRVEFTKKGKSLVTDFLNILIQSATLNMKNINTSSSHSDNINLIEKLLSNSRMILEG